MSERFTLVLPYIKEKKRDYGFEQLLLCYEYFTDNRVKVIGISNFHSRIAVPADVIVIHMLQVNLLANAPTERMQLAE